MKLHLKSSEMSSVTIFRKVYSFFVIKNFFFLDYNLCIHIFFILSNCCVQQKEIKTKIMLLQILFSRNLNLIQDKEHVHLKVYLHVLLLLPELLDPGQSFLLPAFLLL